jgi:hypothetical protein
MKMCSVERIVRTGILLTSLLLATSCGDSRKAGIIKEINSYEAFAEHHLKMLEEIQSNDPDSLFFQVQEVRMAFLDSAGYKRKIIAAGIKESEFSETNLDELLERLVKAQSIAFDVYQLIDRRSIESQIGNLESIRAQMLNLTTQNSQGETDEVAEQLQELESKMTNLRNMRKRYALKIEALQREMETDKSKILEWDW